MGAFAQLSGNPSQNAYLDAHVAVLLGRAEEGMKRLEAAIAANPADNDFLYNGACAYALAAAATDEKTLAAAVAAFGSPDSLTAVAFARQLAADDAQGAAWARRAVALAQRVVANGYRDYAHMAADDDLAAIRRLPAFQALLKDGHLDRAYGAVWHDSATMKSIETHGLDPAAQLERFRQLVGEGLRPAAISVEQIREDEPLLAATVWHRPYLAVAARVAQRDAGPTPPPRCFSWANRRRSGPCCA